MNMNDQRSGFAALFVTILVFAVIFVIAMSISVMTVGSIQIMGNDRAEREAYLLAESGIEDALLRLDKGMEMSSPYSFDSGNGTVNVEVTNIIGGARTIIAEGEVRDRVQRVRAVYQIGSTSASLHYGAHIGEGGLALDHSGAEIIGNVFSNGNVTGNGGATIVNSLIVAGTNNSVENINVLENVESYSCVGASVGGDLVYHENGSDSCSVSGGVSTMDEVTLIEEFAIDQDMLDEWRGDAEQGEVITGDYTVDSDESIGPAKIDGDLNIGNNSTLTLEGTLWVTGTFSPGNNAIVELSDDYSSLSGVMIVDGVAQVSNNVALTGSGEEGSFLMLAGASPSMDESNPAVAVNNNADNAILYAPNGVMVVQNNADVVEVLAHRLVVRNATIEYDVGLANASFSSGPAGGWSVASWREIE